MRRSPRRRRGSASTSSRTSSHAFYPAGSEALLAEATYRFGFHGITAGRWLADRLRRDYGMQADHFDFGRDLSYELDSTVDRCPQPHRGLLLLAPRDPAAGVTSSA